MAREWLGARESLKSFEPQTTQRNAEETEKMME
jgi:hypothetical protein